MKQQQQKLTVPSILLLASLLAYSVHSTMYSDTPGRAIADDMERARQQLERVLQQQQAEETQRNSK